MLERPASPKRLETSAPKKLVHCNFCSAVMMAELFRCPDCGQITEGSEAEVNGDVLANQLRAKLAKRREQISNSGECATCGKKILKGNICSACASLHFRNSVIVIAFASALVTLMLLYLLRTP